MRSLWQHGTAPQHGFQKGRGQHSKSILFAVLLNILISLFLGSLKPNVQIKGSTVPYNLTFHAVCFVTLHLVEHVYAEVSELRVYHWRAHLQDNLTTWNNFKRSIKEMQFGVDREPAFRLVHVTCIKCKTANSAPAQGPHTWATNQHCQQAYHMPARKNSASPSWSWIYERSWFNYSGNCSLIKL